MMLQFVAINPKNVNYTSDQVPRYVSAGSVIPLSHVKKTIHQAPEAGLPVEQQS